MADIKAGHLVAKYLKEVEKIDIVFGISGGHIESMLDGFTEYNIRTIDGLMSALAAPQRAAFGTERFPSLAEKAGALVYALVQNHPFWDGNKRIAAAALRLFVQRNAAHIDASDQELQQFTTRIARGDMHDSDLQAWLAKHLEVRT